MLPKENTYDQDMIRTLELERITPDVIIITMPTAMPSAQIGMKECRQAVAFLVKLG